jgi:uncharacterized membrane protein
MRGTASAADATGVEQAIARLLAVGTYLAIALLAIGVVALLAAGRSPLDAQPVFDPGRLPSDLVALRPEGFLWLGLLAVIGTPAARVAAALVAWLRTHEWPMAAVGAAILGVILLSVALAAGTEG